jgi:hypothetical protein
MTTIHIEGDDVYTTITVRRAKDGDVKVGVGQWFSANRGSFRIMFRLTAAEREKLVELLRRQGGLGSIGQPVPGT